MSTLANRRAGLRLGQADHAHFGLGEHRGRHVGVIDRRRLAAEHGVGEGVPLADRDRRQVDPVGDVADRIDVRHARSARIRSTAMPPFLASATPAVVQPEPARHSAAGRSRTSPCRPRTASWSDSSTQRPCSTFSTRLDRLPGDDLDAAPLHFGAQMLAHVVVEAAQDVVAAIDQRHLGAEPVEDAGELDRDVAAALDQDALRQLRRDETPRSTR